MKFQPAMNPTQFAELMIENNKRVMIDEQVLENDRRREEAHKNDALTRIFESKVEADNKFKSYREFCSNVKRGFLYEAINDLYSKSLGGGYSTPAAENTKKVLINNFLDEAGVNTLLSSFKSKSVYLDEIAGIVEKYTKAVIEKCEDKKECPDELHVDAEFKSQFFDDLNTTDADSLAEVIKSRVTTSVEDFITTNMANKMQIKQIIDDSKNKIDSVKTVKDDEKRAELEAAYRESANRQIYQVKNGSRKSIFTTMVEQMATSCMKDQKLKEAFTDDSGKLSIEDIVESCTMMYTFLEMVNTSKMVEVGPEYVDEFIKNFK